MIQFQPMLSLLQDILSNLDNVEGWFMSNFGYMLPLIEAVVLVGSAQRKYLRDREGLTDQHDCLNKREHVAEIGHEPVCANGSDARVVVDFSANFGYMLPLIEAVVLVGSAQRKYLRDREGLTEMETASIRGSM
jgi:hypothetical protein